MKETLKYQNNSIKSIKKQYFFVLLHFYVYHVYRDSSGALVTWTLCRNSFLNKFTSIRLPNIWIATRPGRSSHVSSKGWKLIEVSLLVSITMVFFCKIMDVPKVVIFVCLLSDMTIAREVIDTMYQPVFLSKNNLSFIQDYQKKIFLMS